MFLKIQVQTPHGGVPFSVTATPVAILGTPSANEYVLPLMKVSISDPDGEGDALAKWVLTYIRVGLIGAVLHGYIEKSGKPYSCQCLSFEFFE